MGPDANLLRMALLGAVLGLDVVSFPQAQLSRPIVAATLAGALGGDAMAGLIVGVVLEFVALETLPFGASRYPEWGSAAVVGGALMAQAPPDSAGALCVSAVAALATGWAGGESMVLLRRLNGQLARAHLDRLAAGSARSVVGLQFAGIGADLLRGFALTVVALGVAQPLARRAIERWSLDARVSTAFVVTVVAIVAGGAVWQLVHAVPRARWLFVGGLVVGLAALGFA